MKPSLEETFRKTFFDLYQALKADADYWYKALNENGTNQANQFLRRSAVRATFAFVEGTIFGLKQFALARPTNDKHEFNEAEQALLREESYELKENGTTKVGKAKLRLTSNLRFAFNVLAKMWR